MYYAKKTSGDQAVIAEEETGKTIAVVYDLENAPVLSAAPAMLDALKEAELVIRHAVQESKGKVRAEIVGGWNYHANKIQQVLAEYGLQ